ITPMPPPPPPFTDVWTDRARRILEQTHTRDGYCITWGIGSGRLLTELARQSQLRIIAIDPDANRVRFVRRELMAAGLYGERVAVHVGMPETFQLPPYIASLMVSEGLHADGIDPGPAFLQKAFFALR